MQRVTTNVKEFEMGVNNKYKTEKTHDPEFSTSPDRADLLCCRNSDMYTVFQKRKPLLFFE